jgi:DNA-binding PadR family transcriptional regulator
MNSIKLGNFEELVLLLVAVLYNNAYSVSIVEEYKKQTGKNINISAIHTVLYRLEKKGFLESKLGEAISERGGKRKRLFYLTSYGKKALDELQSLRTQLRDQIPTIAISKL